MLTDPIIQFFTILGLPLAIGVAIDGFALAEQKKTVSRYVFASPKAPFTDFELAAIRAVLRLFFRERSFRFLFIIGHCLVAGTIIALYASVQLSGAEVFERAAFYVAISVIPAFPFFLNSLLLTRYLYIDRSPGWPWTIPTFALDVAASSALPFLVGRFLLVEIGPLLLLGGVFSGLIAILHNIVFALIILFGALARFIAYISRLNTRLAENSRLREQPFSYIALLIGLTVYGLYLVGL